MIRLSDAFTSHHYRYGADPRLLDRVDEFHARQSQTWVQLPWLEYRHWQDHRLCRYFL